MGTYLSEGRWATVHEDYSCPYRHPIRRDDTAPV